MRNGFYKNSSSKEQITSHLYELDTDFLPALHSYVNIKNYGQKLFLKSLRWEYFDNDQLVGLIAGYLNKSKGFFFISNFSIVRTYRGTGLSLELFSMMKTDLESLGEVRVIRLEVKNENEKAQSFYEKIGFGVFNENEEYTTFLFKL